MWLSRVAEGRSAPYAIAAVAVPYGVLNTVFPGAGVAYAGGIGIAGLAVLFALLNGLRLDQMLLRPAFVSGLTLGALSGLALGSLFVVFPAGRFSPHMTTGVVAGAIASAIGQEIYFRGALLASLRYRTRLGTSPAVFLQALIFAVWHVRAFAETSLVPAVAVLVFAFGVGLAFAWLAIRDRTLLWVTAGHIAFLVAL